MEELLKYIEKLEKGSFKCWNGDEIRGYMTALISIKEKANELLSNTV